MRKDFQTAAKLYTQVRNMLHVIPTKIKSNVHEEFICGFEFSFDICNNSFFV